MVGNAKKSALPPMPAGPGRSVFCVVERVLAHEYAVELEVPFYGIAIPFLIARLKV